MSSYKTGDVLRLELGNGVIDSWEIEAFYYGSLGQESVIEVTKLGTQPPKVTSSGEPVKMFVPANLIHCAIETGLLSVFQKKDVDA